jgi:hypothetical protein
MFRQQFFFQHLINLISLVEYAGKTVHDSFDNESLKALPFQGLKHLMILNYTNRCPIERLSR